METRVSATEAARAFSELLSRVRYGGESFVIERGGRPVGRLSPVGPALRATVADLVRLLDAAPRPDQGYLRAVETAARKQPRAPRSPWPR